MMKIFTLRASVLALVGILQIVLLSATNLQITGTLKDRETGDAIPYVNIGFPGTSIGTASYEDGTFSISIPDKHLKDTLYFSAIGYGLLKVPIQAFNQQEPNPLWMNKEAVQLSEVVVRPKGKLLSQGLNSRKKSNSGKRLTSVEGGSAMALMINSESESMLLESAKIHIHENELPEFKLRCRIFNAEGGMPGKDLLKENIIITSSIEKGELSVDLSPYNLVIDEPFFLVFEWIVDKHLVDYYQRILTQRPTWWIPGTSIENGKKIVKRDGKGKVVERIPMTKEQQEEHEKIRLRTTFFSIRKSSLKGYSRNSSMATWEETTEAMVASIDYYLIGGR